MATRRLERCGVDNAICANLARHNIHTVADLFGTNMLSLMVFADVSMDEIKATVQVVSERVRPTRRSALEIFNAHAQSTTSRYLSTGLREIDNAMKGGLLMGCINEIVGPPGVGKTQFCMSCCVQMLCVNERQVIYIDTELKFSPDRLVEIAQAKHPHLFPRNSRESLDKFLSSCEVLDFTYFLPSSFLSFFLLSSFLSFCVPLVLSLRSRCRGFERPLQGF
jgi:RAD51-like protein 1